MFVCGYITGTKVYFGGNVGLKRYHLTPKWAHVLFKYRISSNRFKVRVHHAVGCSEDEIEGGPECVGFIGLRMGRITDVPRRIGCWRP